VGKAERKPKQVAARKPAPPPLSSVAGEAVLSEDLDRLIHERIRLALVSALAVRDWLSFNELKDLLETTDGNLSVHARKLEDAGYVECRKSFEGRVPKTEYKLSGAGRRALNRYLEHMERLINVVRG
jgi:DNA-binding transcriptional ArsR family regulator